MKLINFYLSVSVLLLLPLEALERHESRHIVGMEVLAPRGTHSLGDLFAVLSELNKEGAYTFPKVQDESQVILRPGNNERRCVISVRDLLDLLQEQVKLFDREYRIDVSRHSFHLERVDGDESIALQGEDWEKDLPLIKGKVVILEGEDGQLRPGNYEDEVLIRGNAQLSEGNAVFKDLKVEGTLKITGKRVHGDHLLTVGRVQVDQASKVEFEKVETSGEILLERGSDLKTKDFRFNENGSLFFGEDSRLILN